MANEGMPGPYQCRYTKNTTHACIPSARSKPARSTAGCMSYCYLQHCMAATAILSKSLHQTKLALPTCFSWHSHSPLGFLSQIQLLLSGAAPVTFHSWSSATIQGATSSLFHLTISGSRFQPEFAAMSTRQRTYSQRSLREWLNLRHSYQGMLMTVHPCTLSSWRLNTV